MHYVALASDYDGTIAHDGVVDDATIAALEKLRAANRHLILVTGRELDDLIRTMPRLDVFERVVAENGAVLYTPETKAERLLAPAPPPAFVERLRELGVSPLSIGRSIVATWEPNETHVLAAIRDLGLELQITFNKGAVMVLPAGITKESGLRAALAELDLSPRNVVAVGDAENDFAFFTLCGMPVAVQNALPMLKEAAVLVTDAVRGAGVAELIAHMLDNDLADADQNNLRQHIALAEGFDFCPHRTSLLLAGSSGGGKTTLTTGLIERLAAAEMQTLILDPEGDYDDLDVAIGVGSPTAPPEIAKVIELLLKSEGCVSVNLLGVPVPDRPAFYARLLPELLALRARTGRPHFVVVDEAHHMLPHGYDPADSLAPAGIKGILYVTVAPGALSGRVVSTADRMMAVGEQAGAALAAFAHSAGLPEPGEQAPVPRGTLLMLGRDGVPARLAVIPGTALRRRHLRKYAEGKLGDDRAFFFRGPDRALNLRATNLMLFLEMAEGVDEATWQFHRLSGDYSRWIALSIKDQELSDGVAALEQGMAPWAEARTGIRSLIEARYTQPAQP